MDKKTKIFFWAFFLLTLASIGVTYFKFVVAQDYLIESETSCDPSTESCFAVKCDPEGEICTGNPEVDTSFSKRISRLAKNIPLCDPANPDCAALSCPEGEIGCTVTYCDPVIPEEGTACSDPSTFTSDSEEVPEE